jgi:hypothetical protein
MVGESVSLSLGTMEGLSGFCGARTSNAEKTASVGPELDPFSLLVLLHIPRQGLAIRGILMTYSNRCYLTRCIRLQ